MEEPRYLEADCAFRLGGHGVRLALAPSKLGVQVEELRTGHRWRGDFDATFIEDLTHKTGNFKQFGIFCSMLESALLGTSDSVSLELLTYADLEMLRSRKVGGPLHPPRAPPSPPPPPLHAKRYLILLYSVEFDRIHYPLPLPYAGPADPAALREELVQLRDELQRALGAQRAAEARWRRAEEELQRERARHRQLATQVGGAGAGAGRERRWQLRAQTLTAELEGPTAPQNSHRTPPSPTPPERRSASRESRGGTRGRSPSPAGPPRFDPTAFVRQRRQKEAELQKQRRGAAFGSGRSSSAGSFRSRCSALSSGSDAATPVPPPGERWGGWGAP
ncbi:centrosomal protein CCDC61 [Podargus strigoides]